MGVATFLFTKLILRRQKSAFALRQMLLSNKLMACTRRGSEISQMISAGKRALQEGWDATFKGLTESGQLQNGLNGGGSNCTSIFNNFMNHPQYQAYQNELRNMDALAEAEQKRIHLEEEEIQRELDMVKTQMAMVDEQLKATDEGLTNAVKESAPKYC